MRKNLFHLMVLATLLLVLISVAFKVRRTEAQIPTIYIYSNGTIWPSTANITSVDNILYAFHANINASIEVQRSNIIIDGNGNTLTGDGWIPDDCGLNVTNVNNVTIRNLNIRSFWEGICFNSCSNCTISGNFISDSRTGVSLDEPDYSSVINNTIMNCGDGIITPFGFSSPTVISRNNITNNGNGMFLIIRNATITENEVANNTNGIRLYGYDNIVRSNNITSSRLALQLETDNSTVSHNVLEDNYYGLRLNFVSNITFKYNTMKNNTYAFSVHGYELPHYIHDIDVSNTIDEKPVYYFVNKTNFSINPAEFAGVGYLAVIKSNNVTVEGLELESNGQAILLAYTNNTLVSNNTFVNSGAGISLYHLENSKIIGNKAINNTDGFSIYYSSHNIIASNDIRGNSDDGIYLGTDSDHNVIVMNNITHNNKGIAVDGSDYNTIYHNNFMNNNGQVSFRYPTFNTWDNGVEGNYWSNYDGADLEHDGIGDTDHSIITHYVDRYPLMGLFHSFDTSVGNSVNVISNSTVDSFQYESQGSIRFHMSNMTTNQTHGFCRVSIPYEVLSAPFNVTVNGANPTYWNYTLKDNGTHHWIYFEYAHSTLEVVIIPDAPTLMMLPLLMTATLLATLAYRRRRA